MKKTKSQLKRKLMLLIVSILLLLVCLKRLMPSASSMKESREMVTLSQHIDGDTTLFIVNGKKEKVRYLAVDTQETVHPKKEKTKLGITASEYVQERLENAKNIELEYDVNSKKLDKYNRLLAWVWVDNRLLQEELVENGLAEIKYVYGDYKYLKKLYQVQDHAKERKLGIWAFN